MIIHAFAGILVLADPAAAAATEPATPAPERPILRHRPKVHELSVGLFAGLLAPARDLGVRDVDATGREYGKPAADLGLRLGYYPSRFFGLEGELGLVPARFGGTRAFLYNARAQAVVQAGWWRVVPFVSLGGGALGVVSGVAVAGNAVKPALTVGGGLKFNASERLAVRVDVRDVVTAAFTAGAPKRHSPEALLSLELRFGVAPKPAPPPPIADIDGDGVADADDWCSHEAGPGPHGCPHRDGDCDGVTDDLDTCPATRGNAPDGCPAPDADDRDDDRLDVPVEDIPR